MLLMVVKNYASEPDSWVSFYGVYDDPELAAKRMKKIRNESGDRGCKLTEHGGWPAYENETTLYYLEEVEVNKGMRVY